jgi:hypothetical protein
MSTGFPTILTNAPAYVGKVLELGKTAGTGEKWMRLICVWLKREEECQFQASKGT